uniref:Putative secreted protein n=1 Tax=Ixodes scapularis TaxID=6945 RepID=Q4PMF6_IXOSC|nr:putative secreted protein [Ixodes scapularis]
MVDDSMKNTGLSIFIMRTTRLIVVMFALFAIFEPIAADVDITGADNMAPNCEANIKALCINTTIGDLEKITVMARQCRATCTYKHDSSSDTVESGGFLIMNRKYATVTFPDEMPCAFRAKCKDGICICSACNIKPQIEKPTSNEKGPR